MVFVVEPSFNTPKNAIRKIWSGHLSVFIFEKITIEDRNKM